MNKIINNSFGRFKDSDVILTSLFGENNTYISIMNCGASIQNWTINNSQNSLCLEAQKFPDSVNHNHFPPILVSPNNPYFHKTET
jgi:galactose mutarotase-like enzyme